MRNELRILGLDVRQDPLRVRVRFLEFRENYGFPCVRYFEDRFLHGVRKFHFLRSAIVANIERFAVPKPVAFHVRKAAESLGESGVFVRLRPEDVSYVTHVTIR